MVVRERIGVRQRVHFKVRTECIKILMLNYPFASLPISILLLWLATRVGIAASRRVPLREDEREDFGIVLAASLTLLSLIIGFSFSMAIARYDQRRVLEEAEANAIGTEFVRTELLPDQDGARVRGMLQRYVDLRIAFYQTRNKFDLQKINADTAQLQNDLWSAVRVPAMDHPNPVIALTVVGMNDLLNSQGYTQAAWWNRIPPAAWFLMMVLALECNFMVGYGDRSTKVRKSLLVVLPLVISIAFVFVADVDSPRNGLIRVPPQNLISLSKSLQTPR